jgi:glycosyltransferase involved in cell wall biosynthesis
LGDSIEARVTDPAVSVVIPTYNRREMVRGALDSVLSQDFGDLECIVVDDGSEDGTGEALAAVEDGRLRTIRRGHAGIAPTKNAGIALARGKYIAFLDSDDVWLPGKLSAQVGALEADRGLGMVYGRYRAERDGAVLRSRPEQGPSGWILGRLLRRIVVQTSTVLLRREVVDRIGGYDEALAYADEYEFFLRVARGWRVAFLDRDLVRYRLHEGNISRDPLLRLRENLRVYRRWAGDDTLPGPVRRIARRRAARYELNVGRELMRRGDPGAAGDHFRAALVWQPFYPAAWRACLRRGGGR